MEKLLHERLREQASKHTYIQGAAKEFGVELKDGIMYGEMFDDLLYAIADEIERYYTQLPRFEDGEPVQFGDEYQSDKGTTNKLEQLHCFGNGGCVLNRKGRRAIVKPGGFVKRPAHKALDADGVPCKRGETVFRIEGDWCGVIEGFEFDDNGEPILLCDSMKTPAKYVTHEKPIFDADKKRIKVGDTMWYTPCNSKTPTKVTVTYVRNSSVQVEQEMHWTDDNHGYAVVEVLEPNDLTHEKPVFDAEGVRICKGDKGWSTLSGKKLAPVKCLCQDFAGWKVELEDGFWIEPCNFTHREPDSLERIKADRELTICEYNSKYQGAVTIGMENHILDRAIALMERGA